MNISAINPANDKECIVILVDPCHEHHPALNNFIVMASQAVEKPPIELIIAVSPTSKEAQEHKLISCSDEWLQTNIHIPLQALNMEYSITFLWSLQWDDAILKINQQHQATLTIVPYYSNLPGHFLNDEKIFFS